MTPTRGRAEHKREVFERFVGEPISPHGEPEPALRAEAESLLHTEAELLDDFRFADWLNLLADDFRYIIPVRSRKEIDGDGEFSEGSVYFDENRPSLEMRTRRLELPSAWSEASPSITRRMVANVRAERLQGGRALIRSNHLIYRANDHPNGRELLAAERWDVLSGAESSLRFSARMTFLDHPIIPWHNLSVFI